MIPKTPSVPKDLVEWLEAAFPDRCPDPAKTDREIWMDVGSVRVVRKLRQLYAKQAENDLKGA